jgi:hypothetical protein
MKEKQLIVGVHGVGLKRSTPRITLKAKHSLAEDAIVSFTNGLHLIRQHFAQPLG